MKKIIIIFLTIFVLFLGFIAIMTTINKKNNNLTSVFGYTTAISTGKSMYPYIKENELLLLHKESKYVVNDIITFKNDEDVIVTHRITEIKDNKYVTKGDDNNFTDGYLVNYHDIYGKLIYKCNYDKMINITLMGIVIISIISFLSLLLRRNNAS